MKTKTKTIEYCNGWHTHNKTKTNTMWRKKKENYKGENEKEDATHASQTLGSEAVTNASQTLGSEAATNASQKLGSEAEAQK